MALEQVCGYNNAPNHYHSLAVDGCMCALVHISYVVCAGNAAVVRSYISATTTESERVGAFAAVSGSQAIGFILGPG